MPITREGPGLGALLLLGCALGAASAAHMQQNCKKTLRTLAFERCSGNREKRSEATYMGEIEENKFRKRHILSIREIIIPTRVRIYNIPYSPVPDFARHQSTSIISSEDSDLYRTVRKFESLPKESSSHLGFDMSIDEIIDLFNEIYERMPRSKMKEQSMREFMALAYECCKNQDLCLTKKELIPIHCI